MATEQGEYGQYVNAEDVLGREEDAADEEEGDSEEGSESASEDNSQSGSEDEDDDEDEDETEDDEDDETESESASETETESEEESDSRSDAKKLSTTGGGVDYLGPGDAGPSATDLLQVAREDGAATWSEDRVAPAELGTSGQLWESVEPEERIGRAGSAGSLGPIDRVDAAESAAAPSTTQLPPLEGSRPHTPARQASQTDEAKPSTPALQPLPPVEVPSRPGSSDAAHDHATVPDAVPLSLPPAPSRNNSRDCSRKSSHQEASTSGSGPPQSPSPLPPINPRSSSSSQKAASALKSSSSSQMASSLQKASSSRKAPSVSSAKIASRHNRPMSPREESPKPSPTAPPHYYKPPPPPPPPPKPKPRERHDVSAVDPLFLQTAVYRTVPNVGRVYDWKLQHEVNAALSKQRKQTAQMEKVLEAARVQLQVREANERAFQEWVAAKEIEKRHQHQQNRRIAYVTSVYQNLVKDDPVERKLRESMWVSNFAYPTSDDVPVPRHAYRETTTSDDSERFRL